MRTRGVLIVTVGLLMLLSGPASAYNAPGPRWPGRTITFHETLPKSYDWELRQAVKAWNTAGAKVRLRKVKSRARADVQVGFGDVPGAFSGYSSIGRQPNAYLHLRRDSGSRQTVDASSRIFGAMLLTHEFGHVLGLDHVGSGREDDCRIMEPMIERRCFDIQPGYYPCRMLKADDVRGVIRLYGGKFRKPSKRLCLLEPAPPEVPDLRVTGGESPESPVKVTWGMPRPPRPGSKVEVSLFSAPNGCSSGTAQMDWLSGDTLPLAAGRWVEPGDDLRRRPGRHCVQARIVNKWGLAGPTSSREITTAPPFVAPPQITDLVENPEYADYEVTALIPADARLVATLAASGQCRTSFDENTDQPLDIWPTGAGTYLLYGVPAGASCLSFFTRSVDGYYSAATTREVVHTPPSP